jgi:hypothetical protein
MIIASNEPRVTPGDIFNFEDWNVLCGDRRLALGLAYNMMAEDKVTSYLGSEKE